MSPVESPAAEGGMPADEDRLLPPHKIAIILGGIHPETVRRYADKDYLRMQRVGLSGYRRISEQSAHELAEILAMDPSDPARATALEALQQRNRAWRLDRADVAGEAEPDAEPEPDAEAEQGTQAEADPAPTAEPGASG